MSWDPPEKAKIPVPASAKIPEVKSSAPPARTSLPPVRNEPKLPTPPGSTLMPPPGSLPPPRKSTSMPPPEVRPTNRVQASYKELAQAAVSLNAASDELGNAIAVLDAALKKLNLGVAAWVTLSGGDGSSRGQDWWWSRDFGYAKVREKWGIALRTSSGDGNFVDEDSEELWLFNDAPRWMRIEAVGKIPDLLDALLKQAQDTVKGIEKKTAQALELASAISTIADETQPEARA